MRLSTFQFYQNNLNNISSKNGQASQQLDKLSSGVRVQTAADDPAAANSILGYKQELSSIARYQNNIDLAENRLQREESLLTSAETLTQQVKELMLQANNGTYTTQDKSAMAAELSSRIDELLDLANSRDEFGQYVFGGFQTDKAPFVRQPDGSVSYQGDGGQRELAISNNVKVGLNHDGLMVFGQVPNPKGDVTVGYALEGGVREPGLVVERAAISNMATFDNGAQPYQVVFSDNDGVVEVLLTDKDGNALTDKDGIALTPQSYQPGQSIEAGGMTLTLTGEARAGDKITLDASSADGTGQDTLSVFDALNRAKSWLEGDGNTAGEQSELADILAELDAVGSHFTRVRADTGIRLQRLDNQRATHDDMSLTLDKVRSGMEDLDYAQAIGELNQTMVALEASQSVFGKLQGMSLFNYI
ncbi:flagellar hook-associated protein FlgL [Oceanisphaera psychrotolerans]|uniref:Flagellar hook-associated protein 3 n=1 Tax=Oceanisphaera psychrotolerans TaxID=1414654 RepID=A0A1J4QBG6_9GAMM|nr:flagellar hook-associated protein FlgL [Oceanisphaera psychrotolerans]OIN07723.1 flagellar hook-associated protein 3 [Oceanisphaera psychrotolerans]